MSKLTLALIAGSIAVALTGAAQAETKLRVGNGMNVVTIPTNSNIRADANPRPAQQPSTTSTYFGSWNGAGPGIRN